MFFFYDKRPFFHNGKIRALIVKLNFKICRLALLGHLRSLRHSGMRAALASKYLPKGKNDYQRSGNHAAPQSGGQIGEAYDPRRNQYPNAQNQLSRAETFHKCE
jgi:hypothetical protein